MCLIFTFTILNIICTLTLKHNVTGDIWRSLGLGIFVVAFLDVE